jgi:hypothetical protein
MDAVSDQPRRCVSWRALPIRRVLLAASAQASSAILVRTSPPDPGIRHAAGLADIAAVVAAHPYC